MGTTNILDLNNRLTKVEKGNVAQNSYTSLKNKPKINSVTLTGNKSLADIGAAAAADLTTLAGDVGDKTQLNTTDKSSTVAAINELVIGASLHIIGDDYTFADLTAEQKVTWFTNWTDNINFPVLYGSGVLMPAKDVSLKAILYIVMGAGSSGEIYANTYKNGAWGTWKQLQFVS